MEMGCQKWQMYTVLELYCRVNTTEIQQQDVHQLYTTYALYTTDKYLPYTIQYNKYIPPPYYTVLHCTVL
jgi:hypothetical protein